MFTINFSFDFSGVTIIDALDVDDLQTGTQLHNDLRDLRSANGTPAVRRVKVRGLSEFHQALDEVHQMTLDGHTQIIHIEAHGNGTAGLYVGNGEFINWEQFTQRLYEINIVCHNNLAVVLAACHGMYAIDAVDVERPCPYAILIAPLEEIRAGVIADRMGKFYEALIRTLNLRKALKILDADFKTFQGESFFYGTFALAYRTYCMGRGGSRHEDMLVARAINGFEPSHSQVAAIRQALKANNRNPVKTYELIGGTFLHGGPLVPFAEIQAFTRLHMDQIAALASKYSA